MSAVYRIGIYDPPLKLVGPAVLDGAHIVIQPASYGRVLFTRPIGVEVSGRGAVVSNCLIETR